VQEKPTLCGFRSSLGGHEEPPGKIAQGTTALLLDQPQAILGMQVSSTADLRKPPGEPSLRPVSISADNFTDAASVLVIEMQHLDRDAWALETDLLQEHDLSSRLSLTETFPAV
jgi:hypothetical protein